jgi:transcription-repair coupling factor (superfamily II helicase)
MQFLDLLERHPSLEKITFKAFAKNQKNAVVLENAPPASFAPLCAYLARKTEKTVVLVCPTNEGAENAIVDLTAMMGDDEGIKEPLYFPAPDRSLLEDDDRNATQERLAVLDALHRDTCIVVTSAIAVSHPTLPVKDLVQGYDELVVGGKMERDDFILHLDEAGYERVDEVEAPGQFAVRGGILDFYPPAGGTAVRLELFGDEIDSLRSFDLETQRSTGKLKSIRLTPPRELYLSASKGKEIAKVLQEALDEKLVRIKVFEQDARDLKEKTDREVELLKGGHFFKGIEKFRGLIYPELPTLFDHVPDDAIVIFADPNRSENQIQRLLDELQGHYDEELLDLPPSIASFEELQKRALRHTRFELHLAADENAASSLDITLPPTFNGALPQLAKFLKDKQMEGKIIICATSHARRVREILADQKIGNVHLMDEISKPEKGHILIFPKRLTGGFFWGDVVVMCDAEMFGWQTFQPRISARNRKKKKATEKSKFSRDSSPLGRLADLQTGDFVVHINHGIAKYGGVVQREIGGAINEYLMLEYADSDKLYVPASQLDRVQKYLGSDASVPGLTPLKGGAWEKAKTKAKEEALKAAQELAVLYAKRDKANKKPVAPDSMWQREMEASFPYEETPSQLQAIKDSKADMEKPRPMDRLVCGDVGFGKTEVAVRAAFKAIQDGRQVAVLVPTTVLAQQHHQTFAERMSAYPIRLDVVSRFKTPSEIKRSMEAIKEGALDLVVGTHRLIQPDVEFKNLGLVIVDEEHRFGVMQKERLKELRSEVDILTMSATPIPRTLQMALGGLREISLITDPPPGRLPIRTYVMAMKDSVLRAAIERELEREGQVYYVHNRVESIGLIASQIQKLVPHARIGVGHGQMGDEELEQVMLDFMHGRTDVLVSTTIIENGIDLPNANTIICDHADRLGLSQMYQLRGRVGRSQRQAYAYFFHGQRGKLNRDAEDRFAALQENTDLGSGFRIAMRDLEIRGAGDVLGIKQSGSIAAVGMDLYAQFLAEAVAKTRGEKSRYERKEELPEVDVPIPAYLPEDYISDEVERLSFYRKMTEVRSLEDVDIVREELRDRFGALPAPAFNLMRLLKVRVHLMFGYLRSITKSPTEVLVRLKPGDSFSEADLKAMFAAMNEKDKRAHQHVSLRKLEGLAINTRALGQPQLLRLIEVVAETAAEVRGRRIGKMQ